MNSKLFVTEFYNVEDNKYSITILVDYKEKFDFFVMPVEGIVTCDRVCIDTRVYEEVIRFVEKELKIHRIWCCNDIAYKECELINDVLTPIGGISNKSDWTCAEDLTTGDSEEGYVEW